MAVICSNLDKMVTKVVYAPDQFQTYGVDLTVRDVKEFLSAGQLAFSNKHRKFPDTRQLIFPEKTSLRGEYIWLDPGAYMVTFNEVVEVPDDAIAITQPRLSLIKMGANINTPVWGPRFNDRAQGILEIHNQSGLRLRKFARLARVIFLRMETVDSLGEVDG